MPSRRFGLPLLLAGLLLAFYCHQQVRDYSTGIGRLKRSFMDSESSRAAGFAAGRLVGIGAAVAGGVILLRKR